MRRPRPKVIGMKKNSTGIGRVWNTVWLYGIMSDGNYSRKWKLYLQPWDVMEEDTNAECQRCGDECGRI